MLTDFKQKMDWNCKTIIFFKDWQMPHTESDKYSLPRLEVFSMLLFPLYRTALSHNNHQPVLYSAVVNIPFIFSIGNWFLVMNL